MSNDDPDGSAGGPPSDDAPSDSDATEGDGKAGSDPSERPASESSSEAAPLEDLANRVSRQRRGRSDEDAESPMPDIDSELSEGPPPDSDEDPFDRMSVGEIDEETLWSSLGSDDPATDAVPLSGVDPVPGVETVDDAGADAREHVVPKDKYCQSCPYLDDPPELACTHEGTEIVEVVDSERFRVRNCPMVEDGVEPKK